jgi:predicted ATP-dependent serine protease
MLYTIHRIDPTQLQIRSTENGSSETIQQGHNRYDALTRYLNEGKWLSITNRGTWSGVKPQVPQTSNRMGVEITESEEPIEIKLTQLQDLHFSEELFKPLRTNMAIDPFLSTEGGFLPGSNIMVTGGPGVGKTSVLCELLHRIREADPTRKVLFISAEMNQLDMARYLKRFPQWGTLPILFLSDYADGMAKRAIEETLHQGWDIVLTDSYTEVNDSVKEESGMSRGKVEKWFLSLMNEHNMANNLAQKYTTFITILQLNKGGVFVGSNKLKHMTSAMLHLEWKGSENTSERYMHFSKNRAGEVNHKLFFTLEQGLSFDEIRYKRDLLNQEMIAEERERLKSEEDAFDRLFGSTAENEHQID